MSKKFDLLLEKATDSTLLEPAWENILICVDNVKSGETLPKAALSSVRKRYRHENPHVRHHALLVLEALVKNCGEKMHKEVATKEFMEDFKHLVEESPAEKVKEKLLEIIQCWSHAFRNKPEYKIVIDTNNLMKLEGYSFPPLRESDAMFDAESAPEWQDSDNCHRCRVEFGLLTRKHHCRNCGQIFCDKCSSKYLPLPHIGIEIDVRVCETCFDVIRNKQNSSSKISLAKMLEGDNDDSKDSDTKGVTSNATSGSKTEKTAADREEEELQLALAISQSEAEEKDRQKQRQFYQSFGGTYTSTVSNVKPEIQPLNNFGYAGTMDKTDSTKNDTGAESDGELAKYLNRGYWEARRSDQKKGILRNSPTPSAPVAPHVENHVSDACILNGKVPENGIVHETDAKSFTQQPAETNEFVESLRSSLEIFVTRIRNDIARGRSVVTDSSVQAMFVNLTSMHAQLLQKMGELEDTRGYYESLQDKLAQIKDAREAVDALREDYNQRRQSELLALQRQQQVQMAQKLGVMRSKKHEMLEQQRILAIQRIDEQRRDLEMRRQMQLHGQTAFYRGDSMSMHQMAGALPSMTGQINLSAQPMYYMGAPPALNYQNMPLGVNYQIQPVGQHNPNMLQSQAIPQQQQIIHSHSQEFTKNVTSAEMQAVGERYGQYGHVSHDQVAAGFVPGAHGQQVPPANAFYGYSIPAAPQLNQQQTGAYFFQQPPFSQQEPGAANPQMTHAAQNYAPPPPHVQYAPAVVQHQQCHPAPQQPYYQQNGAPAAPAPAEQQPAPVEAQLISFD